MSSDFLKQCGGFTPTPDVLVQKYNNPMVAQVWGAVWRYCQKTGKAQLTFNQIAARAGVSRRCAIDHIKTLIGDGFIEDETPGVRNEGHIYSTAAGELVLLGMRNLHTSDGTEVEEETELPADGMQELPTDDREGMQNLRIETDWDADNADQGMQNLHEIDSSKDRTPSKTHDLVTEVEGDELKINFELPPHLHGTLKDKWVFYRDDDKSLLEAVVTSVTPKRLWVNVRGQGLKQVDPAKRVYYQNGGPGLSPVEVGGYEPKAKQEPMNEAEKGNFEALLEIMPQADFVKSEKWRDAQRIQAIRESAISATGKGITPADFRSFASWHKNVRWADADSPPAVSLEIIKKNWAEYKDWSKNNGTSTDDTGRNTTGKRETSSQAAQYYAENEINIRDSLARLRR